MFPGLYILLILNFKRMTDIKFIDTQTNIDVNFNFDINLEFWDFFRHLIEFVTLFNRDAYIQNKLLFYIKYSNGDISRKTKQVLKRFYDRIYYFDVNSWRG